MNKIRAVVAAAAAGALAFSLAGCAPASSSSSEDSYPGGTYDGDKTACVVDDKAAMQKVEDGKSTTDYRIYSSCGVFGVQDDPFIGQWNSADVYGSIKIGGTYDFEAYGWRNGFFSTFPNIKKAHVTKVETETE